MANCVQCGKVVTDKVASYSLSKLKSVLCYTCQKGMNQPRTPQYSYEQEVPVQQMQQLQPMHPMQIVQEEVVAKENYEEERKRQDELDRERIDDIHLQLCLKTAGIVLQGKVEMDQPEIVVAFARGLKKLAWGMEDKKKDEPKN